MKKNKIKFGCSYFGNRFLEHFKFDIRNLKKNNFSKILLTFSENDYFFYADTIKNMVSEAKNNEFEVYVNPWGVLGMFGGEAFSKWLLDNSSIWQIDNENQKQPIACPNNPKSKELLLLWLEKALEFNCDYIFWDEPHFYFKDFQVNKKKYGCFCDVCKKKFKNKYGYSIPKTMNNDFLNFRNNSLLDLIYELSEIVKNNNKKNNLCLLPTEEPELGGIVNWNNLKNNNIDILSTDPYWQRKNLDYKDYVSYFTEKCKSTSTKINCQPEIWIQAYKIIKNRENEINKVINMLYKKNINSIMFWSYKGGYPMSFLQSDDYKKVWETITNSINK